MNQFPCPVCGALNCLVCKVRSGGQGGLRDSPGTPLRLPGQPWELPQDILWDHRTALGHPQDTSGTSGTLPETTGTTLGPPSGITRTPLGPSWDPPPLPGSTLGPPHSPSWGVPGSPRVFLGVSWVVLGIAGGIPGVGPSDFGDFRGSWGVPGCSQEVPRGFLGGPRSVPGVPRGSWLVPGTPGVQGGSQSPRGCPSAVPSTVPAVSRPSTRARTVGSTRTSCSCGRCTTQPHGKRGTCCRSGGFSGNPGGSWEVPAALTPSRVSPLDPGAAGGGHALPHVPHRGAEEGRV